MYGHQCRESVLRSWGLIKRLRGTRRDGSIFSQAKRNSSSQRIKGCAWFTYRTVELRHWWKRRKNKLNQPQSEPMNVLKYCQTSLIRTPKGQNQVSALQRCPYYRDRECMIFGISGTKRTVRNREVSVGRG